MTANDLSSALAGDPVALDVHLSLVERDVEIEGCNVKVHCHCLTVDANGRVQPHRLAEFMRDVVADYAIPKSQLAAARLRDAKYRSSEAVAALVHQARKSFTDLSKSGEGGEMLLFLLAERFLRLPQILCKMDLKTDSRMHYHGADGVYAGVTETGILKLYWGESKLYGDVVEAVRNCLASLAPFLVELDHEEAERERDLILLSDKADLSDKRLTDAIRVYFDKRSPLSKRVKYCGIALVGFDVAFYPNDGAAVEEQKIIEAARSEIVNWGKAIGKRIKIEKLQSIELEIFCLPIPSAKDFRSAFLQAMGKTP